jgi:hypothetical protein
MVTCVLATESKLSNKSKFPAWLKQACSFPVLLAILLAAIVFLVLPKTNADPDIGWHLRNAQYLLQHHAFIRYDMYSFTTQGKPWMDHEWLAELPFYVGWHWFGARGIFIVTYAAMVTVILGIFALATLQSRNVKAAFLVSFVAIAFASVSFGPRTLLFGWVFLVAELAILYRFDRHPKFIWILPPLFLCWVNTHGSWLIGLVLFLLFILSGCVEGNWGSIEATRWTAPQARKLAAVSVLSVLALFVNPYGWRLAAYPFNMAFHQKLNIANVVEWRTLDFHSPRGKIVLVLLAVSIVLQLVRRKRWKLYEVAFLLLAMYASFTYTRFLFLAAILLVPFLAKDLHESLPAYRPERDKPWLNAAIILACLLAIGFEFPANSQLLQAESGSYPLAAQTYLEQFHPKGNVLSDYLWGGYLIWNLRQIPVFMDSRVDIFEYNGIFKDYLDLVQLRGSLAILDKYQIRYVLFRKQSPLSYLLQHNSGWKIDYQDTTAILFERIFSSENNNQRVTK